MLLFTHTRILLFLFHRLHQVCSSINGVYELLRVNHYLTLRYVYTTDPKYDISCIYMPDSVKYIIATTSLYGPSQTDLRILIGLLGGHNTLNRHLTLLKTRSDALCPVCEEEQETSLHFLGRCSATMER